MELLAQDGDAYLVQDGNRFFVMDEDGEREFLMIEAALKFCYWGPVTGPGPSRLMERLRARTGMQDREISGSSRRATLASMRRRSADDRLYEAIDRVLAHTDDVDDALFVDRD